jgi:NCS1 family nucleobase:cation symporter-1
MLNYADFTRFAPSAKSVRWGTLLGLPINWTLFAFTSVIVSAGSLSLYGTVIFDPASIFSKLSNSVLLFVGAFLLVFAAVGVNVVANFVSPAFDFANVWPARISFRTGGIITAILALASLPWKLYSSPIAVNYFLGALGAMLGPLFAIMIVDYYVVRRRKVDTRALFSPGPDGRYHYKRGTNYVALAAFIPSACIAVIVAVVPTFANAAPFSWYIGALVAGMTYWFLATGPMKDAVSRSLEAHPETASTRAPTTQEA